MFRISHNAAYICAVDAATVVAAAATMTESHIIRAWLYAERSRRATRSGVKHVHRIVGYNQPQKPPPFPPAQSPTQRSPQTQRSGGHARKVLTRTHARRLKCVLATGWFYAVRQLVLLPVRQDCPTTALARTRFAVNSTFITVHVSVGFKSAIAP